MEAIEEVEVKILNEMKVVVLDEVEAMALAR